MKKMSKFEIELVDEEEGVWFLRLMSPDDAEKKEARTEMKLKRRKKKTKQQRWREKKESEASSS